MPPVGLIDITQVETCRSETIRRKSIEIEDKSSLPLPIALKEIVLLGIQADQPALLIVSYTRKENVFSMVPLPGTRIASQFLCLSNKTGRKMKVHRDIHTLMDVLTNSPQLFQSLLDECYWAPRYTRATVQNRLQVLLLRDKVRIEARMTFE